MAKYVELEISSFLGENTAQSFSEIDIKESRKMMNALPKSIGSLAKRPGTIPLTDTALVNPIKTICNLWKNKVNSILATSNLTLYKYDTGVFTAQTMGVPLNTNDIDYAQFKDANGQEVLVIADGGSLKYYDGAGVSNIVPAANDSSPLPTNNLATINTNNKAVGCLVHNTRVVIWDGTDHIFHSKIGYHDYFPQTDYQRFVRENDYVQTCVTYGGALLVFMRRHVGVLFGHDIDDWEQDFLDTQAGCLNPKTVQTVIFPDGRQEVFYLSDNGVHSVYTKDTINLDSSTRYSTRSITENLVDWKGLGVTVNEWKQAKAYFYKGQYWLVYPKGSEWKGLVYDTNASHWYPVQNIQANDFYHDENDFYFVGNDGHLKIFDSTLHSDWNEKAKTTGTPIHYYWYSKLLSPGLTGYDHFWDVLMIEAQQFEEKSTLDVEVNTYQNQFARPSAIKTATLIWGKTDWGDSQWANPKLTDIVNNAKRIQTFVKGQYMQVKIENNRDEPAEIYLIKCEIRKMEKY